MIYSSWLVFSLNCYNPSTVSHKRDIKAGPTKTQIESSGFFFLANCSLMFGNLRRNPRGRYAWESVSGRSLAFFFFFPAGWHVKLFPRSWLVCFLCAARCSVSSADNLATGEVAAQRHGCPVRHFKRILAAVGPWLQQRAQHRLSSPGIRGGSERTPAAARSGVDWGEVSGGP